MKTAIYARQSLEKQDSVSIEAQIEKCELICKVNNWDSISYHDAGYSGSNMNRPSFEKLLNDIKQGKINRVIAYRLDRISRSISDFANLLQLFEKHNVQFMSATENFDTSSPIGRAMVYIVMVFAQLERETITQRITDNYFFRAKEGLFTGGYCPMGYRSIKIERNGKKASTLEIDPNTSPIVKNIFEQYVNEDLSTVKIARYLNENKVASPLKSTWTTRCILRILRNPAYAENNLEMYEYFQRSGYQVANAPEEFDGKHGLGLFGKEKGGKKDRKLTSVSEQILVIGEFPPLISSELWLRAQYKLSNKQNPPRSGTSKATWLSGMLSCACCGFSMNVKYTKKRGKEYKYIHCRGHIDRGDTICTNGTYYECGTLENQVKAMLLERINSKEFLERASATEVQQDSELLIQKNALLAKVYGMDNEIKNFLSNLGKGNSVVDNYINQRITELDGEKRVLLKEIEKVDTQLYNDGKNAIDLEFIHNICQKINDYFDQENTETKHALASSLIKRIRIDESGNIAFEWYI